MAMKIWLDGKLVDKEDAKVSVFDHGLLYGDGVFEGIRVYSEDLRIQRQKRLYESAKAIRIAIPWKPTNCRRRRPSTPTTQSTATSGLLSPAASATRPQPFCKAGVIIIAASIQLYPEELYERGLKVVSSSTSQHPMSRPRRSGLNYSTTSRENRSRGQRRQRSHHVQPRGYVAEASGENILRPDGVIMTPAQARVRHNPRRVMRLARARL